jgi:hypothetical protein
MDYYTTLMTKYPDKRFYVEDTYESLQWLNDDPKPTDEQLQQYWEEIKDDYFKDIMRNERNMLLTACDFRVVSDYPNRDKWLIYRQELRDFPSIWTQGTEFPQPPE